jgi:hypothetical protein
MPTISPIYGTQIDCILNTTGIKGLPANNAVGFGMINNNAYKVHDWQVTINVTLTASSNDAFLSLYMLGSTDTIIGDTTLASSLATNSRVTASLLNIPNAEEILQISTVGMSSQVYWSGTIGRKVGVIPVSFAMFLANQTGNPFHATALQMIYLTPIYLEYV